MRKNKKGFTLIEIMVVVGIFAFLATMLFVFFGGATKKARDTKRINDLGQIGRFLSFGCLVPDGGPGDYDLADLLEEYKSKYPKYEKNIPQNIKDPRVNSQTETGYRYVVTATNQCALYANLENEESSVSLPALSNITPGGGKGILETSDVGVNGTKKYFQISN